jgi:thiamine-phosphate pyrophosphorylase
MSYQKQVELACLGGADMIQLRDKNIDGGKLVKLSAQLQNICKAFGVYFTLNDSPDIAAKAGCDGVHVGQSDMPYSLARKIMPFAIIGVSALALNDVKTINDYGSGGSVLPDYIGVTVFSTPSKTDAKPLGLEGLKQASETTKIPLLAIGGVNAENAGEIINAGACGVAVIRAVCGAKNVKEEAKKLKEIILEAHEKKRK